MSWTAHRLAILKRMHKDGMSYTQIGIALGCSRSAISGKVMRLAMRRLPYDGAGRWAIHEDEVLGNLYASGISHQKIGEALGRSEYSIEHRINKLGLGPRQKVNRIAISPRARPRTSPKPVKAATAMRLIMATSVTYDAALEGADIPFEQRKTLLELHSGDCRYPFGTAGCSDFFFCGGPTAGWGRSYCGFHHSLSHQPWRAR